MRGCVCRVVCVDLERRPGFDAFLSAFEELGEVSSISETSVSNEQQATPADAGALEIVAAPERRFRSRYGT